MNLLAIDTSTHRASVALKVEGKSFGLEETELKRHAEWLLPAIHHVLEEAKVELSALDGIVFGQGPGSFTGLRVTCSIAKGLALGAELPLYPVSGLASIAFQVQEEDVLAMIDARMQAWYWAGFRAQHCLIDEQVTSPSAVYWHNNRPFVLAGIGFQDSLETLPAEMLSNLTTCYEVYPTAQSMIEMIETNGGMSVSALDARPKYIRQQVT